MYRTTALFSSLLALSTSNPIVQINSSSFLSSPSIDDLSNLNLTTSNTSSSNGGSLSKLPYPPIPFFVPFNTYPRYSLKVLAVNAQIPSLDAMAIALLGEAAGVLEPLGPDHPGPSPVFLIGPDGSPYLNCVKAVGGGPIIWDVATAVDFLRTLQGVVRAHGFREFRRFLIVDTETKRGTNLASCKWKKEKKGSMPGEGGEEGDGQEDAQGVTFS